MDLPQGLLNMSELTNRPADHEVGDAGGLLNPPTTKRTELEAAEGIIRNAGLGIGLWAALFAFVWLFRRL
jgi:hypothetical protein